MIIQIKTQGVKFKQFLKVQGLFSNFDISIQILDTDYFPLPGLQFDGLAPQLKSPYQEYTLEQEAHWCPQDINISTTLLHCAHANAMLKISFCSLFKTVTAPNRFRMVTTNGYSILLQSHNVCLRQGRTIYPSNNFGRPTL